jgi:exodeoxyribonuclease V alpha subunit
MRLVNGKLPWPWIDPEKALPWIEQKTGLRWPKARSPRSGWR